MRGTQTVGYSRRISVLANTAFQRACAYHHSNGSRAFIAKCVDKSVLSLGQRQLQGARGRDGGSAFALMLIKEVTPRGMRAFVAVAPQSLGLPQSPNLSHQSYAVCILAPMILTRSLDVQALEFSTALDIIVFFQLLSTLRLFTVEP